MNSKANGWAQVITGLIVAGLVVACVWNDVVNNVEYGLKISFEMAVALGVFGGVVGVIPFASGFVGWNRVFVAAFAICVTVTVYASATAYINKQGANIVHAADKATAHKIALADTKAARATLARITEQADTETLVTMVATARARLTGEQNAAKRALGGAPEVACTRRRRCRKATTALTTLLDRLAQAKARDAATKRLTVAKADVAKGGAMVDAGAELIARHTGSDAASVAQILSAIMATLVIIGTQVVAACGHQAAKLIAGGFSVIFASNAAKKPRRQPEAAQTLQKKNKGGRKATITREQALEILRKQAGATDGKIIASGAAIAVSLGVARSTVCDPKKGWLAYWVRTGVISVENKGRKTALTIKKAAA